MNFGARTVATHQDWSEALWLFTERTPSSTPRTEIAWSIVQIDPRHGGATTRRRHIEILQDTNQKPGRSVQEINASALLGAWMAHNDYGDLYAADPDLIDPDQVGLWLLEHLTRISHQGG